MLQTTMQLMMIRNQLPTMHPPPERLEFFTSIVLAEGLKAGIRVFEDREWCKNNPEERLKRGIPSNPDRDYGDEWNNWYDLLDKPQPRGRK
jgi:hypothetical protein